MRNNFEKNVKYSLQFVSNKGKLTNQYNQPNLQINLKRQFFLNEIKFPEIAILSKTSLIILPFLKFLVNCQIWQIYQICQ